jgi:hypothetical protein
MSYRLPILRIETPWQNEAGYCPQRSVRVGQLDVCLVGGSVSAEFAGWIYMPILICRGTIIIVLAKDNGSLTTERRI